jgi:hypothetical protein
VNELITPPYQHMSNTTSTAFFESKYVSQLAIRIKIIYLCLAGEERREVSHAIVSSST